MGKTQPGQVLAEMSDESHGYNDFSVCLGDLMRGERATMGKSLLDVERELKIKAVYISAIENADADAFETPGFIPGYVRSYARYLGMDPDKTFTVFCTESGYVPTNGIVPSAAPAKAPKPVTISKPAKATSDDLFKVGTPFLPEEEGFLARLEPAALGSTLVLLALISLIGYGAWSVLNEVQKVNVAPADSTPEVLSDLDPVTGRMPTDKAGQDDPDFANVDAENLERLDRLYRPQALDVPVLISRRDAPISTLDPSTVGTLPAFDPNKPVLTGQDGAEFASFDPKMGSDQITVGSRAVVPDMMTAGVNETGVVGTMTAGMQQPANQYQPQVVKTPRPGVQVVAVRPSWVRIKSADGSTLFEGILNAGETFDVPEKGQAPVMKVGESGAVYFSINGQLYGPAGERGSVSAHVELASDKLAERFPPVTRMTDQDLSRYVAELNENKPEDFNQHKVGE